MMLGSVVVDVLSLAPLYGLVALGFVIVYRFTGVLNFAQGALFAVGAYVFYAATEHLGLPLIPALVFASVIGFLVGLLLYQTLFRPLGGRSVLAVILVTVALGSVAQGLMILIFTGRPINLATFHYLVEEIPMPLGGGLSGAAILLLGTYLVFLCGLGGMLHYLRAGIRGRAAGENPTLASYRGVAITWVFGLAWGASTFLAFLAGSIYIVNHQLTPTIAEVALHGFAAAMVGGLDSIAGTLIGSLIVALGVSIAFQYVGPVLSDVMPYLIMFIVLFIRPWGVWGSSEMIDRV